MSIDLQSLEYPKILELKEKIVAEISRRELEEKSKAKKQIQELARAYGLSIEEVLGKMTTSRKPVNAKYRSKLDPSITWSGRGRKPIWVVEHLNNNGTLEDLEI